MVTFLSRLLVCTDYVSFCGATGAVRHGWGLLSTLAFSRATARCRMTPPCAVLWRVRHPKKMAVSRLLCMPLRVSLVFLVCTFSPRDPVSEV